MTFISDFENNVWLPAIKTNLPTSGATGTGIVDGDNVTWNYSGGYASETLIVFTDGVFTLEDAEEIKILVISYDLFKRIDKWGIVIILSLDLPIDNPENCL